MDAGAGMRGIEQIIVAGFQRRIERLFGVRLPLWQNEPGAVVFRSSFFISPDEVERALCATIAEEVAASPEVLDRDDERIRIKFFASGAEGHLLASPLAHYGGIEHLLMVTVM